MSSLTEVQRLIGLSLNKLQMGRAGRGGLSLHKNLLVATVLNKARDVYMQETMYMNYRLMACGQFSQEDHEEMEEEDTPDTEDYEEDSESDVEDDSDNTGGQELRSLASKEYSKEYVGNIVSTASPTIPTSPSVSATTVSSDSPASAVISSLPEPTGLLAKPIAIQPVQSDPMPCKQASNGDEGFIDETDCDCDARNYRHSDGENRVPFQYCFNCAPFHPSNGRGPTLVSPQLSTSCTTSTSCLLQSVQVQQQEDKLIYDMDSKSTQNQPAVQGSKRKRQISSEETEDAINSILPKKRRESSGGGTGGSLDDSGFADEDEKVRSHDDAFVKAGQCRRWKVSKMCVDNFSLIFMCTTNGVISAQVFHPAFRGQTGNNGMEVDQITSLVSIFSFGQQLFAGGDRGEPAKAKPPQQSKKSKKDPKDQEEDSDSDSDTSSDSGHSSDDPDAGDKKGEEVVEESRSPSELLCSTMAGKEQEHNKEVDTSPAVATAV